MMRCKVLQAKYHGLTQVRGHAGVQLSLLNSVWLKQPYQFAPPFKQQIQNNFGAQALPLVSAQEVSEILLPVVPPALIV